MLDLPHPRLSLKLFGHEEARAEFQASLQSKKLHHAWIIAGEEGIGKATLAYMLAYQIFSGQKEKWEDAHFAKIKAQSHPNLFVLERPLETTATGLTKTIAIEQVRRIHGFFGSTSGEPGKRICIIDSLDDLNNNGANALLKLIEEPPNDALFLMIAHRTDQILPTIRSRSRLLKLNPLSAKDMSAIFNSLDLDLKPQSGSVREVIMRQEPESQALIASLTNFFKGYSYEIALEIADKISGKSPHLLDLFLAEIDLVIHAKMQTSQSAHYYEVWQKINEEARKTRTLNLDRKVFTLFTLNLLSN